MTQTESISLEQDFSCQTENLGGLEQSVQEALESPVPVAHTTEQKISGFWRRLAALAIDVLILAAIGFVVGTIFFNALAHLGSQGFWVGLLIAVVYFSWMNSSFNNGQTIGKRVMKIRVVDVLGNTISVGTSIKRSALLLVPFMYSSVEQESLDLILKAVALFTAVAIVYLYIFNNRTRQTVHDLALKTFVVYADYDLALEEIPVSSRHLVTMTLVGMLMIAFTTFAWPQIITQYNIPGTSSTLEELQKDPDVYKAAVNHITSDNSAGRSNKMEIVITVKKLPAPIYMKAKQISELALQEMPDVRGMDSLSVTVNYGYNIGIARYQKSLTYTGTPSDWECNTVKIARSAQTDVSLGIGK
ncbi:MAG: RDD family protein [Syntrophomonadaceae bacterium]